MRGNGPDSRCSRQAHDLGDHFPLNRVEDDRASRVHVVHVQPAGTRVDGKLVSEIVKRELGGK